MGPSEAMWYVAGSLKGSSRLENEGTQNGAV